jgi:hypothetical protein
MRQHLLQQLSRQVLGIHTGAAALIAVHVFALHTLLADSNTVITTFDHASSQIYAYEARTQEEAVVL